MIARQPEDLGPHVIEEASDATDPQTLMNARQIQLLTEEARIEVQVSIRSISPYLDCSRKIRTVDQQACGISGELLPEASTMNSSSLIAGSNQL